MPSVGLALTAGPIFNHIHTFLGTTFKNKLPLPSKVSEYARRMGSEVPALKPKLVDNVALKREPSTEMSPAKRGTNAA